MRQKEMRFRAALLERSGAGGMTAVLRMTWVLIEAKAPECDSIPEQKPRKIGVFAVGRYPAGMDRRRASRSKPSILLRLEEAQTRLSQSLQVYATKFGMRNFKEIGKELRELLGQRVLVLDGAMGTMLQQRDLTAADFGGAALEGCNEVLVRTRPDVVLDIHRKYFAAGADIVETNSFGGTPLVLAEYGLEAEAHELNKKAAELARAAADEFQHGG